MKIMIASLTARPLIKLAFGIFLSGLTMLYFSLQRRRKHQIRQAERRGL